MKKFSLNKLSKSQLKDEELNALKGGKSQKQNSHCTPNCGCKVIGFKLGPIVLAGAISDKVHDISFGVEPPVER